MEHGCVIKVYCLIPLYHTELAEIAPNLGLWALILNSSAVFVANTFHTCGQQTDISSALGALLETGHLGPHPRPLSQNQNFKIFS